MEPPESGIAMEFPAGEGVLSCSPPTMPPWLRRRLSEPKTSGPSTVEEIQSKLREADLRRQKFHESLSSKARPKPRSPVRRSSSHEDDIGQRLEAKLLAAEENRLSILANAQMRLAKIDELRQAAKTQMEMRFKRERDELGTKVEMRFQQAEANRLRILRADRQRRATLRERTSQSLMRRMARENKNKERVCAAMSQKRADAEKKRLGLLEAEKRRARARVMQAQKIANNICYKREVERSEMKNKLEDRLQRARRNRSEYLKQRGRTYAADYNSWDSISEGAEILARKLSRCWREFTKLRKTTSDLAKYYNGMHINEKSVKSLPFEQFALLIQSSSTLYTTKALLDRLENRFKISQSTVNPSGSDDIDHLLERVASPKKKDTPRKAAYSRERKKDLSARQAAKNHVHLSRYQVRIVLCAYMILGHPDAVISGQGERETALVKSAVNFVKEFDLLIKILLNGPLHVSDEESGHVISVRRTFRSQLASFDSAWCSFLNSFVVWKTKDARSLEEDLVRAACQLELSMMQTCQITPKGDSAHLTHDMKAIQKQVSEDQRLLREKVQHLGGDAGIKRMEDALSDTRMKFVKARENGNPNIPLPALMLPPSTASSSSLGSSVKANKSTMVSQNQSSVVRSLFGDEVVSKEASSPLLSPSTSQISKGSVDWENLRIVNEYVHGEHFALTDRSTTTGEYNRDNAMVKIKETMEKAFWDGIVESVKQKKVGYNRVVELTREVRDGICAMAPQRWRPEITEAIDLDILAQVLNSGNLDNDYLGKILEYALVTLRNFSAPAYEDELARKHQQFMKDLAEMCRANNDSPNFEVVALIQGLRFVLEQIKDLKQEISKARIRILEPLLKGPEALYYLGKAFTSRYGQPSHAHTVLPLTARWLSSAWEGKDEEWNEFRSSVLELTSKHGSLPSYLPSTTLRTGGSSLVEMAGSQANASCTAKPTNYIETIDPHLKCKGDEIDLLVRLGLLKLVSKIAGLTENELPETMNLNFSRLRSVQSQIQKIIVIATSLLVLRQTLVSQRIVSSQPQMDNILSSSFKRLSACLDSVEDAGIPDIIKILLTAIGEDDSSKSLDPTRLHPMKEIMSRMLSKSLQEEDAVFLRVSRAVYLAARGVVLGGTGKQGRELAEMALQKVGAALLIDELVQAGNVLVVAAKVSVIVHRPWYANLTKE